MLSPREAAVPGALACVPGLAYRFGLAKPDDEGSRRAALAKWMTDPKNVLTWRSIVNRIWHYHFGRGIVATPSDLGRMGAPPTHPELLDWLAVTFRDDEHGSLKKFWAHFTSTSLATRRIRWRTSALPVQKFGNKCGTMSMRSLLGWVQVGR